MHALSQPTATDIGQTQGKIFPFFMRTKPTRSGSASSVHRRDVYRLWATTKRLVNGVSNERERTGVMRNEQA